jgi:formylglycine-generating enzyme required for sulfatase activity
MAFDLNEWQQKLEAILHRWKPRFIQSGNKSVYAFLSASTLWPIVEAAQGGDWGAIGVLGNVLASLGSNLLANQIQGWKDQVDAAKKIETEIEGNSDLRAELNLVLEKLNAIDVARLQLEDDDRKWFVDTLEKELNKWGHRMHLGDHAIGVSGDVIDSIIVSGDHVQISIIHQVSGREDADKRRSENLREAYLNRLYEKLGYLTLSGIDPKAATERGAKLSLQSVYVSLMTSSFDRFVDEKGNYLVDENGRRMGEDRVVSAVNMLNKYKRLVLLGDPGSGKSTFVNFVGLCMVGEMLGKEEANILLLTTPPPLDERSRTRDEKASLQIWDHGTLLPVHVILRDFAARYLSSEGEGISAGSLWDYICQELEKGILSEFSTLLHEELLEEGGILLLDGLDEVPEARNRRAQICQVVEDFIDTFPKCRVLVTSRTYAYQNQEWQLSDFEEAVLAPFNEGQIRQFIDQWYQHTAEIRGQDIEDAQGRAVLLRNAIYSNERLRELAERPLLLTLMASLHAWRGGNLPENREQLYADVVDLLLDNWEQPKVARSAQGEMVLVQPSISEYLKVDKIRLRNLLNRLAFEAHSIQTDLTGTADIPESDLVAGLLRLSNDPETSVNPLRLIEYLSNRAGLLLPRGVEVYSFPHRTFQEYLAACYLTDHDYPNKVAELARQDPERWREVALLAGAKAAGGSASMIWSLADALCYQGPNMERFGEPDEWGGLFAGQAIAETAELEQVSPANLGKLELVKNNLEYLIGSRNMPAIERVLAGNILARLGDPRFDPDAWYLPRDGNLGFIEIPAGRFLMGSDPEKDEMAYGDEYPQHTIELTKFFISKWPVTVGQYQTFVKLSGYTMRDNDAVRGVANHPVVLVTWHDAMSYCKWLTSELCKWNGNTPVVDLINKEGWVVTLPSEAQWEKAARGTDGRIYPWGDEFDKNKCNMGETGIAGPSSLGCFPSGASPYGVEDMSGNVWEWTRSKWVERGYPYPVEGKALIEREDIKDTDARRVLRGGSFFNNTQNVRCAFRNYGYPDLWLNGYGFRVVVCPGPSGGE